MSVFIKSLQFSILLLSVGSLQAQETPENPCEGQGRKAGRKGKVTLCFCDSNHYKPNDPSNPCLARSEKKRLANAPKPLENTKVSLAIEPQPEPSLPVSLEKVPVKEEIQALAPVAIDCEVPGLPAVPTELKSIPLAVKAEPMTEIALKPVAANEYLSAPDLTPAQIEDLFSGAVTFNIFWEAHDFQKQGDGTSTLFHELKDYKLFSLAFADLYQIDRKKLDQEAAKRMKDKESFEVRLYFQRYKKDVNKFGTDDNSPSEKECMELYASGERKTGTCFPLLRVDLIRKKNGKVKGSVRLKETLMPYGPGTGSKIITAAEIVSAMDRL